MTSLKVLPVLVAALLLFSAPVGHSENVSSGGDEAEFLLSAEDSETVESNTSGDSATQDDANSADDNTTAETDENQTGAGENETSDNQTLDNQTEENTTEDNTTSESNTTAENTTEDNTTSESNTTADNATDMSNNETDNTTDDAPQGETNQTTETDNSTAEMEENQTGNSTDDGATRNVTEADLETSIEISHEGSVERGEYSDIRIRYLHDGDPISGAEVRINISGTVMDVPGDSLGNYTYRFSALGADLDIGIEASKDGYEKASESIRIEVRDPPDAQVAEPPVQEEAAQEESPAQPEFSASCGRESVPIDGGRWHECTVGLKNADKMSVALSSDSTISRLKVHYPDAGLVSPSFSGPLSIEKNISGSGGLIIVTDGAVVRYMVDSDSKGADVWFERDGTELHRASVTLGEQRSGMTASLIRPIAGGSHPSMIWASYFASFLVLVAMSLSLLRRDAAVAAFRVPMIVLFLLAVPTAPSPMAARKGRNGERRGLRSSTKGSGPVEFGYLGKSSILPLFQILLVIGSIFGGFASYITVDSQLADADPLTGEPWRGLAKGIIEGLTNDRHFTLSVFDTWGVSSASFKQSIDSQDLGPTGIAFKPDGAKMYEIGSDGDLIYESDLDDINPLTASGDRSNWEYSPCDSRVLGFRWNVTGAVGVPGDDPDTVTVSAHEAGTTNQIGSTWTEAISGNAGSATRSMHFDSDPLDGVADDACRYGMIEMFFEVEDNDGGASGDYTVDSRGDSGDTDDHARGYLRANAILDDFTKSNSTFNGNDPSFFAFPDPIFLNATIGEGAYGLNVLTAKINDSATVVRQEDNSSANHYRLWDWASSGNTDTSRIGDDFGNDEYSFRLEFTAQNFGGDNEYVWDASGHDSGFSQTSDLIVDSVSGSGMDINSAISISTSLSTPDNGVDTNESIYNRGEAVDFGFVVLNARGEPVTESATISILAEDDASEANLIGVSATGDNFYNGSYTIVSGDRAAFDSAGSPKHFTAAYSDNSAESDSAHNVSSRYFFDTDTMSFGHLMRGDTNRIAANINNVRGENVFGQTWVNLSWHNPSGGLEYSANRSTSSGTTADYDQQFGNDDGLGNWTVRYAIPFEYNNTFNFNNSLAEATSPNQMILNNSIVMESVDVSNDGQSSTQQKIFNPGEAIDVTGTLRHSDGGFFRVKNPSGDSDRTARVQIFNGTYSNDGQEDTSVAVSRLDGTFTADMALLTDGTLEDTYVGSLPNQTEPREYGIRIYDGTSSASSNSLGNDANSTNQFDVDKNLYILNSTTNETVFNRGEAVLISGNLYDGNNETYQATGVTMEVRDTGNSIEDSQSVNSDSGGFFSYSYTTASTDTAEGNHTGSRKSYNASHDDNLLVSLEDIHSLSSWYLVNAHAETDSDLDKSDSDDTFPDPDENGQESTAIIAADVVFGWGEVRNARNESLEGVDVNLTYFRPDGTQVQLETHTTGSDGWTTDFHDVSTEAPSGVWRVHGNVTGDNGNSGGEVDDIEFISPYTGNLGSVCFVKSLVGTDVPKNVWNFGDRVTVRCEFRTVDNFIDERLDTDNNDTRLDIVKVNQNGSQIVLFDDVGMTWFDTGKYDFNVTLDASNGFENNREYVILGNTKIDSRDVLAEGTFFIKENQEEIDPLHILCSGRVDAGETVYCGVTSLFLNGTARNGIGFNWTATNTTGSETHSGVTIDSGSDGDHFFNFTPSARDSYRVKVFNRTEGISKTTMVQVIDRTLTAGQNETLYGVNALAEEINSTTNRTEATVNQINTTVNDIKTIVQDLETVLHRLEEFTNTTLYNEMIARFDAVDGNLTEIDTAVATVNDTVKSEAADTRENLTEEIGAAETALKNLINSRSDSIDGNLTELDTTLANLETRMDANFTDIRNSIDDLRANNTAEHRLTRSNLTAEIADLQAVLEARLDSIDGNLTEIDAELTGIQGQITDLDSNMESNFTDIRDRLDFINSTTSNTSADLGDLDSRLASNFTQIQERFDSVDGNLTEIDTSLTNLEANIDANFTDVRGRLTDINSTIIAFRDDVGANFTEAFSRFTLLDGNLTELRNNQTEEHRLTREHVTNETGNISLDIRENVSAEARLTRENVTTDIANLQTALEARFDNVDNALVSLDSNMASNFTDLRSRINSVNDTVLAVNTSLHSRFDSVDGKLASLDANLESNMSDIRGRLTDINSTVLEMGSNLTNVNSTIHQELDEIDTTLADFESNVNSNFTDIRGRINNIDSSLSGNFTGTFSRFDSVDGNLTEIDDQLVAIDSSIDTNFTDIRDRVTNVNSTLISFRDDVGTNFTTTLANIEEVNQTTQNIWARLTGPLQDQLDRFELFTNTTFFENNTAEHRLTRGNLTEETSNTKTDIQENLTSEIRSAEDRILTNVTTETSDLQTVLEARFGDVDSALVSLDSNMGANFTDVRGRLTNINTTLLEVGTNLTSVNDTVKAEAADIRENATTQFNDLFTQLTRFELFTNTTFFTNSTGEHRLTRSNITEEISNLNASQSTQQILDAIAVNRDNVTQQMRVYSDIPETVVRGQSNEFTIYAVQFDGRPAEIDSAEYAITGKSGGSVLSSGSMNTTGNEAEIFLTVDSTVDTGEYLIRFNVSSTVHGRAFTWQGLDRFSLVESRGGGLEIKGATPNFASANRTVQIASTAKLNGKFTAIDSATANITRIGGPSGIYTASANLTIESGKALRSHNFTQNGAYTIEWNLTVAGESRQAYEIIVVSDFEDDLASISGRIGEYNATATNTTPAPYVPGTNTTNVVWVESNGTANGQAWIKYRSSFNTSSGSNESFTGNITLTNMEIVDSKCFNCTGSDGINASPGQVNFSFTTEHHEGFDILVELIREEGTAALDSYVGGARNTNATYEGGSAVSSLPHEFDVLSASLGSTLFTSAEIMEDQLDAIIADLDSILANFPISVSSGGGGGSSSSTTIVNNVAESKNLLEETRLLLGNVSSKEDVDRIVLNIEQAKEKISESIGLVQEVKDVELVGLAALFSGLTSASTVTMLMGLAFLIIVAGVFIYLLWRSRDEDTDFNKLLMWKMFGSSDDGMGKMMAYSMMTDKKDHSDKMFKYMMAKDMMSGEKPPKEEKKPELDKDKLYHEVKDDIKKEIIKRLED